MKVDRFKIRRWIVAVLVLVVFGIYVARLIGVQIINAQEIRKTLDTGYISTQQIPAVRGEIVDRNGLPLVVNKLGYDVIVDKVSLPQNTQNDVILRLLELFEQNGAAWTDHLPVTAAAPFAFLSGADKEVAALKDHLEIHQYATVEDALYHLTERYKLQAYSLEQARKIAGVRYGMERRGFDVNVLYTFASDVDIDLVLKIKEYSYLLPGVDVQESALRSYERGDLAPHIIGRTGPIYKEEWEEKKNKGYAMDDILGKSGVELAMEEALRGKKGERRIILDDRQQVVGAEETVPASPGQTVYLTIDAKLQELLQKALQAQILRLQQTARSGEGKEANKGAAVVVHCKTGEILAIATYPSYDNNTYRQDYDKLAADPGQPLYNLALQGLYAPGSIFKPVVGTVGMSSGMIDRDTIISCTRIYQRFTTHRFTCLSAHGNLTLAGALRASCNIFFYETGFNLGIDQIDLTAKQYGLGEPTGIELLEERIGQRSNPETYEKATGEKWTSGNVVQSAIGQLAAQFTPLQIAGYAAALANRGERMELTIVKEIRDYARDNVLSVHEPRVLSRVDGDQSDFEAVIEGMVLASRPGGTAAGTFGGYSIDVASKTGTPESNMLNSTFICFAPAADPEIAIAVVIENGYHGYTSAPVARAIFDEYFGFANANPLVPKTEEQAAQDASGISEAQSGSDSEAAADLAGSQGDNLQMNSMESVNNG